MKRILVITIMINLVMALLAMGQTKNKKTDRGSDGYRVALKDTNRSIVFGYFEYEDLHYNIVSKSKNASYYDSLKGEDMEFEILFKQMAGSQVARMWRAPNKVEKAKQKGKTEKVIEIGAPIKIVDINFEKSNPPDSAISVKPNIINKGSGSLIYFVNVPIGNWQIRAMYGGGSNGFYRIETTPEYDDFIGTSFTDSGVTFPDDPIILNISTRGVYYTGSYHISISGNLTFTSKTEFVRSHKKEFIKIPSEKELLQELSNLSTGSDWEKMIQQRLAEIEK